MFSRTTLLRATALFLPLLASAQNACNNSPDLCNRPYNNITYLGAHDSPFLRNEKTSFSTSGNHYYNTTVQLDAGVRLLSAQVHKTNESGATAWHLCHSSCDLLDAGSLGNWLREIKTWMDANPHDVVTVLLVNSDNASPADLGPIFSSSGLDKLAYTPPSTSSLPKTWPTLDALIGNNTRLMTFVASLSPASGSSQYPYLMDEFTFIYENDFENTSPTNYSCNPNRPTNLGTPATAQSSGRMFLQNHFLYSNQLFGIQSPNETYANVTNAATGLGSLGEALQACSSVNAGKAANFVLVDFFNVGPAIESVDRVNGVGAPVGRKSVSVEPLRQSRSSGAAGGRESRGSWVAVVLAVAVAVAFA
ncbi:PLC-like phosphodiesterase [Pyrenophora seminiperda CCB06]|uniref:PLC-like phosphodiesterase n=1 Tax=Pyrenophora seminiperda CCB06 TaxID=1302712 RepID=A0A3M7MGJ8_9PLEO|nr:PLC-like phosphodiesterase [Pyrenophora seminiperda CCB06]